MKYSLLLAVAVLSLMAACNKQPDEVTSREDELRGGKWRQISGTITDYWASLGHDTTYDYWKTVDTCFEDNTFTFEKNYTGTQYLGNLKCTIGEPDSQPFNWELAEADEHLRIYNAAQSFQGEDGVDATIVALNANRMTLRFKRIIPDPATATKDTLTFTNVYTR